MPRVRSATADVPDLRDRTYEPALVPLPAELAPDVVIAAVGAVREKCAIPGAELPHVWDGDTLRDVLLGAPAPGLSLAGRLAVSAGRLLGITRDASKLRQASNQGEAVGMLERRITLLEKEVQNLTGIREDLGRLVEEMEFQRQLMPKPMTPEEE